MVCAFVPLLVEREGGGGGGRGEETVDVEGNGVRMERRGKMVGI